VFAVEAQDLAHGLTGGFQLAAVLQPLIYHQPKAPGAADWHVAWAFIGPTEFIDFILPAGGGDSLQPCKAIMAGRCDTTVP